MDDCTGHHTLRVNGSVAVIDGVHHVCEIGVACASTSDV